MILYEHFNTTNQTSPYFEQHENYVSDIHRETCAFVQMLPYDMRCNYVRKTPECGDIKYFVDYCEFIYCHLNPRDSYGMTWGTLILLALCGYMFVILASTADCFFCPSLGVVSQILGLSENLAGVTLLAFGNGAPDFFTSIAGIDGESRRLYSDILGSTMFVVFVVGGLIVLMSPFRVTSYTFIRDVLVLLVGVLMLDYIIESDKMVTVPESIALLSLYVVYIVIIVIDQVLLIRHSKHLPRAMMNPRDMPVLDIISRNPSAQVSRRASMLTMAHYVVNPIAIHGPNHLLFRQFIETLCRDFVDWGDQSRIQQMLRILRSPVFFLFTLLIPVVDYDSPLDNWSKLLDCMHIVALPTLLAVYFLAEYTLWGLPGYCYVPMALGPVAMYVFWDTRTDKPPVYHRFFSIMGVLGSMFMVNIIACELISILEVLGIISTRSSSYLGCTFLSWGNSMGDLTANILLAHTGYQIMGFSACLGGPMFAILVVVGVIFMYKTTTSPTYTFYLAAGTMGDNCFVFLVIGLSIFLAGVIITNFTMRRSMGVFMLCIYGTYFLFTTLGELEFIHTFGTDHLLDYKPDATDFNDFYFAIQYAV